MVHRKPTMADVARLAGVGTMTVSRVLSGTAPVSENAALRVHKAIDQLHYRPNELARAFRGQRSHTVGLILPYLYDSFFATCAHAIQTAAKEHGYSVLSTTSNEDPAVEYAEAEQMLQRHVEGLLVIPARSRQSKLTRSFFGKTPVVVLDRPVSDPTVDAVLVENASGSQRMVEHLIEHGHKRISFMGLSRSLYTINARHQGYKRALETAGLAERSFFGCVSREDTQRAIAEQLGAPEPPTAIFTSNNLATRYVLAALLQFRVKIPSDVALAGFDDFDLAESMSPPLTVVRQPVLGLGSAAATLLFNRILNGDESVTGQRLMLPVELVLRRSCGCKGRMPVIGS